MKQNRKIEIITSDLKDREEHNFFRPKSILKKKSEQHLNVKNIRSINVSGRKIKIQEDLNGNL